MDMVDNDTIKDLKFPTLEFTNDSSGKLLLNIMFAISKQYSQRITYDEVITQKQTSALNGY